MTYLAGPGGPSGRTTQLMSTLLVVAAGTAVPSSHGNSIPFRPRSLFNDSRKV